MQNPIVRDNFILDEHGLKFKGEGGGWDDLEAPLFGKKLLNNQGTLDFDYENGLIKMQKSGDLDTLNNRLIWPLQYRHKFLDSGSSPVHWHIHWLQPVDDWSAYTFKLAFRVHKNGYGVDLDNDPWTVLELTSTPENNLFDFSKANGKPYIMQITTLPEPIYLDLDISDILIAKATRTDDVGDDVIKAAYLDAHAKIDLATGSHLEFQKEITY